jgi:hypothetical protein
MARGNVVIMSDKTTVNVTLGYTLNLGNFQSLRVDLGCTDFVREGENTDQAMERVYKFIETKVVEKIEDAKKELE